MTSADLELHHYDYSRLDVALLRTAVEWAEAEAAKTEGFCAWDQDLWQNETPCGTTYCIAGYICHASGGDRRGHGGDWPDFAAKQLRITNTRHSTKRFAYLPLFEARNTIEDVRAIAALMARAAGETL